MKGLRGSAERSALRALAHQSGLPRGTCGAYIADADGESRGDRRAAGDGGAGDGVTRPIGDSGAGGDGPGDSAGVAVDGSDGHGGGAAGSRRSAALSEAERRGAEGEGFGGVGNGVFGPSGEQVVEVDGAEAGGLVIADAGVEVGSAGAGAVSRADAAGVVSNGDVVEGGEVGGGVGGDGVER